MDIDEEIGTIVKKPIGDLYPDPNKVWGRKMLYRAVATHFLKKGRAEGQSKGGWQGTAQEWRDEIISLLKTYRGIETICPKCSGWGVRAYGDSSTWRHSIGGQTITSDLCDGCWGSGDADRKWVSPRETGAKIREGYAKGAWDAVDWLIVHRTPQTEPLAGPAPIRASFDMMMLALEKHLESKEVKRP